MDGGELWHRRGPIRARRPALAARLLLAGACLLAGLALWLAPARAGAQAPALPQPTDDITLGSDGSVWIALPWADRLVRVAPDGTITEISNRRFRGPERISTGPDGSIWFVAGPYGSRIGRVGAGGRIRMFSHGLYPYGTADYGTQIELSRLVPGADGNMWFSETNGIGRITPTGSIRLFTDSFGPFDPVPIAAGPDGNIWFAENPLGVTGRGAIGWITPAGAVTRFRAGLHSRVLVGDYGGDTILAGPDGNLWFTVKSGLARITPTGRITEFHTAKPPDALAVGADGNVWFATAEGRQVGFVTPAGRVRRVRLPRLGPYTDAAIFPGPDASILVLAGTRILRVRADGSLSSWVRGLIPRSTLHDLFTGPDGTIWFTETSPARIGRIGPSGLATQLTPIASITSATMRRGTRRVQVDLACPAGAPRSCAGTLRLDRHWGARARPHPFTLRPGARAPVVVALPRSWRVEDLFGDYGFDMGVNLEPRGYPRSAGTSPAVAYH